MYNLRYHIASLAGVFIALSLGLLLGTIVSERGTLDDQRDTMINKLEQDFVELSQRNNELASENEARADFVNAVVPVLVAGSLADKDVVVIANAGRSDGLAAVEQAITDAGGIPRVVTLVEPGLALQEQHVIDALSAFTFTGTDLMRSVAASLAVEWVGGAADRPVSDALSAAGVLRIDDLPAGTSVEALVCLAAWEQRPDTLAVSIARAVSDLGLPAAGAQAMSLDTGMALAAVDAGLSAVDQMGRPEGAYALAKVLSGEASGYFGTGTRAVAPFPRP
ncbi:MAG: hypothetical protein CVT69_00060 [Actinobacteria bacterium HGW-Actinobacteria-9]|jgi:hypothetical protein|nr:MAG: hypothetical protein CVT69_00060 [Actinobacteria bacterium HGW-Actinobacteria-9]